MLPLALLFTLLFVLALFKGKLWWSLLLPSVAAMLISGFNYYKTQQFHFSSISTINRVYYNAKLLIAQEYGTDSAENYTTGSLFETPRSAEAFKMYSSNLNHYSNASISQHKWAYVGTKAGVVAAINLRNGSTGAPTCRLGAAAAITRVSVSLAASSTRFEACDSSGSHRQL